MGRGVWVCEVEGVHVERWYGVTCLSADAGIQYEGVV